MDDNQTNPSEDPTVLEALQRYFNKPTEGIEASEREEIKEKRPTANRFVLAALLCFLAGQFLIEFLREALSGIGVLLLLGGFILSVFAFLREIQPAAPKVVLNSDLETENEIKVRLIWLLAAFVMAIAASLMYRQGSFSFISGLLWLASIVAIVAAFFQKKAIHKLDIRSIFSNLAGKPGKLIAYLILITFVLVFQLGRLQQVPPEIISSQVEAFTQWMASLTAIHPCGFHVM